MIIEHIFEIIKTIVLFGCWTFMLWFVPRSYLTLLYTDTKVFKKKK